jgi:hypothetical protein
MFEIEGIQTPPITMSIKWIDRVLDIVHDTDVVSVHQGASTMSRVFAYCRVSTFDQTTENQVHPL